PVQGCAASCFVICPHRLLPRCFLPCPKCRSRPLFLTNWSRCRLGCFRPLAGRSCPSHFPCPFRHQGDSARCSCCRCLCCRLPCHWNSRCSSRHRWSRPPGFHRRCPYPARSRTAARSSRLVGAPKPVHTLHSTPAPLQSFLLREGDASLMLL